MDFKNLKIDTKKLPEYDHDYFAKKFIPVGAGKKPYNCAGWLPLKFCKTCGQLHMIAGNCNKSICPDCSTKWRYTRTETAVRKLFLYKMEHDVRLMHIIVSIPPENYANLKNIADIRILIRKEIYPFLKTKNIYGGWMVFHPFRIIQNKKKELFDYFKIYDLDEKLGEFRLWKILTKIKNWRDFVYWSPHFHLIGISDYVEEAKTGDPFVFKRIGDLNNVHDAFKCCMYILSHVGVYVKNNAELKFLNIRWFGDVNRGYHTKKNAKKNITEINKEVKKQIDDFSETEGITRDKCGCGGYLEFIKNVHRYMGDFSPNIQRKLRYAYAWVSGDIPPPDLSTILDLIDLNAKFEKNVVLKERKNFKEFSYKKKKTVSDNKKYNDLVRRYKL